MTSLLIATPCKTGLVTINYMMSLLNSVRLLEKSGLQSALYFDVGKAGIDMPRSVAASYFLESDHTHLLFIDDDIAWQPELIPQLLALDLDIVGVPCRLRDGEISYNMRIDNDGYKQSTEYPFLMDVKDIGTGMMMIKKTVFAALRSKVEWVTDFKTKNQVGMFFRHNIVDDPEGKFYMSEDLFFCRQAREAGFQIWAYVDAETAHTGSLSFKGNYANILEKITELNFRDGIDKQPLRIMGSSDG